MMIFFLLWKKHFLDFESQDFDFEFWKSATNLRFIEFLFAKYKNGKVFEKSEKQKGKGIWKKKKLQQKTSSYRHVVSTNPINLSTRLIFLEQKTGENNNKNWIKIFFDLICSFKSFSGVRKEEF